MKSEQEKIKERYENRTKDEKIIDHSKNKAFINSIQNEREKEYKKILSSDFDDLKPIKLIEIGAGAGGNIPFFLSLGMPVENIHVNELLPDRVEILKENYPGIKVFEGDALEIPDSFDHHYDVVFQSTVFTSILNDELKEKIAKKMTSLLKEGGLILWYDFVYDNPSNPDVKGVSRKEVEKLFPDFEYTRKKKVTLAPPIGRRVKSLYPIFNIPPLRTHFVAGLKKK